MSTYMTEDPELEFAGWEADGEYYPDDPEFLPPLPFLPGRGRARRPSPAAPTRPYTPPPATQGNYVTKPELERALTAVRGDMQRNAAAIRGVGSQVDALSARTRSEIAALRNESRNTTQMLALLPMLAAPQTLTTPRAVTDSAGEIIPANTRLARAEDGLSSILPLLVISGGLGGGTSAGQTPGQDQSQMMLPLLLIVALRNRP